MRRLLRWIVGVPPKSAVDRWINNAINKRIPACVADLDPPSPDPKQVEAIVETQFKGLQETYLQETLRRYEEASTARISSHVDGWLEKQAAEKKMFLITEETLVEIRNEIETLKHSKLSARGLTAKLKERDEKIAALEQQQHTGDLGSATSTAPRKKTK